MTDELAARRLLCFDEFNVTDVGGSFILDSNSHGARPVHLIITMIKWIRTSSLSIKNSLSGGAQVAVLRRVQRDRRGCHNTGVPRS